MGERTCSMGQALTDNGVPLADFETPAIRTDGSAYPHPELSTALGGNRGAIRIMGCTLVA